MIKRLVTAAVCLLLAAAAAGAAAAPVQSATRVEAVKSGDAFVFRAGGAEVARTVPYAVKDIAA
ncbi:MAG: hypothetical protein MUE80_08435, partial [Acidobacteria bacterium]|nr:hypothetical protein [Acidobacteriota bacterium]